MSADKKLQENNIEKNNIEKSAVPHFFHVREER